MQLSTPSMQPPLPPGFILQKRYRLIEILGEGGFGRTYLAEDLDRYNERCAIKEYNPNVEGTYALEHSERLFVREAEVLYKIEHPRIPKFWASFEQGERLFLVQDYVEGQTYRALLDARLQENRTFSLSEIVAFLQQMLPVLAHIHAKGIIHRDISPDNIICRQCDGLPVLIDFGVVKEIAQREGTTGLNTPADSILGTTVGKHGYSPPEQLQTGKIYPNSDLYSLAATAVVLMTGRNPEELLNESTMTWRWHQWVPTLELWLAQLLNKMLSPRPDYRYKSAVEVDRELRSRVGLVASVPANQKPGDLPQTKSQSVDIIRDSKGKCNKTKATKTTAGSQATIQTWMAQGIYIGIILFVALGTILLFRLLVGNDRPTPQPPNEETTGIDLKPAQ